MFHNCCCPALAAVVQGGNSVAVPTGTAIVMRERERAGLEALAAPPLDPALAAPPLDPALAASFDVPAVAALISAGLIYLVLRSKTAESFLGVDLRSDQGAARIERAAASLLGSVLAFARDGGAGLLSSPRNKKPRAFEVTLHSRGTRRKRR
jgi:hypothetical protein